MNRYFKVDTDYLKEELQPCLLNMKDSIQKSYQISSKLSVPSSFSIKQEIQEVQYLVESLKKQIDKYEESFQHKVYNFDNYQEQMLISIKKIEDIIITK